jgi:hypothetical protein
MLSAARINTMQRFNFYFRITERNKHMKNMQQVGAPAAVPLAASGVLFGSGLIGLGSWSWWKRRGQVLTAA